MLAGAGTLAVSGGAQQPPGETIQLVSKSGTFKFIDVAPRGRGPESGGAGDQFLFSAVLTTRAGKRVGRLDARCTITKGGAKTSGVCEGVYALAEGDIHLLARLKPEDDVTGAVVGGTGRYAGARGTFGSKDRPGDANGDPSDETITLLP